MCTSFPPKLHAFKINVVTFFFQVQKHRYLHYLEMMQNNTLLKRKLIKLLVLDEIHGVISLMENTCIKMCLNHCPYLRFLQITIKLANWPKQNSHQKKKKPSKASRKIKTPQSILTTMFLSAIPTWKERGSSNRTGLFKSVKNDPVLSRDNQELIPIADKACVNHFWTTSIHIR